ncbi:HAD family hydrolase [Pengzhenrongella frigida]|uniref:HAD family hydrolase n=1 Tax=Pengzhenrongella frigida TaxID=1259133 RepID=A0A4Q5MXL7_9MICO|nr:HAD family hydrolase [Cellulomonas sp. HLT2-17]
MTFAAVIFDWRGTLVTTLSERQWVRAALCDRGRAAGPGDVDRLVTAIRAASGVENRLEGPGVDSDADYHQRTYLEVFHDAGCDDDLARALYEVESDPRHNPFATDALGTVLELRRRGVRVAVLSDIHFDVRPAFTAAGFENAVDVFTLSFEQGIQKPDSRMFTRTVGALGVEPADALMVGDRSGPDGAAVEAGITTLLLPPLTDLEDRRLHRVLALCATPEHREQ